MQRIKLEVFRTFFEKNLTGNEIDFLLALSYLQDERGCVYGLHYREMMELTGMSAQSFYNCKESLQEKQVISAECMDADYDITILGNDFTCYTDEDWNSGNVKYIKTNGKMFHHPGWKTLKPKQKLLAMDLYNINQAGGRTYRIGREKFLEKYANTEKNGVTVKGLLDISRRTLQKYIKMLKLFFYIGIRDGQYLITLRPHMDENINKTHSETEIACQHTVKTACRRTKIGVAQAVSEEAQEIVRVLCYYQKNLLEQRTYIPDIFNRMLEVINENRPLRKKWKRYLKKTLFHKLLKEEFLAA